MHRSTLLADLELYRKSHLIQNDEIPFIKSFVDFVTSTPACFDRSTRGHITGGAWIVSHDFSHALLTHHKKLNIWCQLGGHADGDPDSKRVALKEAYEESGIESLALVIPSIFDIDIHAIPTPCELHYEIRYLLKAPPNASFKVSEESHDLAWVPLEKIGDYTQERTVLRMAEKVRSDVFSYL